MTFTTIIIFRQFRRNSYLYSRILGRLVPFPHLEYRLEVGQLFESLRLLWVHGAALADEGPLAGLSEGGVVLGVLVDQVTLGLVTASSIFGKRVFVKTVFKQSLVTCTWPLTNWVTSIK